MSDKKRAARAVARAIVSKHKSKIKKAKKGVEKKVGKLSLAALGVGAAAAMKKPLKAKIRLGKKFRLEASKSKGDTRVGISFNTDF